MRLQSMNGSSTAISIGSYTLRKHEREETPKAFFQTPSKLPSSFNHAALALLESPGMAQRACDVA